MPGVVVDAPPEFISNPQVSTRYRCTRHVLTLCYQELLTQLYACVITSWSESQLLPSGRITKSIGALGDVLAETQVAYSLLYACAHTEPCAHALPSQAILHANSIPIDEISEEVSQHSALRSQLLIVLFCSTALICHAAPPRTPVPYQRTRFGCIHTY